MGKTSAVGGVSNSSFAAFFLFLLLLSATASAACVLKIQLQPDAGSNNYVQNWEYLQPGQEATVLFKVVFLGGIETAITPVVEWGEITPLNAANPQYDSTAKTYTATFTPLPLEIEKYGNLTITADYAGCTQAKETFHYFVSQNQSRGIPDFHPALVVAVGLAALLFSRRNAQHKQSALK